MSSVPAAESDGRADLLAAVVLAALVGIFFWRVLAGGVLLAADILAQFDPWQASAPAGFEPHNRTLGDTIDAMYPNVALLAQGWREGRAPLWNPYTAGGVPLGTLITSGALYPLNLLYVLLPVEAAFGPHAMLRVFVAGWFTYLFLRALRLEVGPALLGALVFAFSGWQIVWLGWPHTYVSAWLPALFWSVERLIQRGQLRYLAAAGASVALLLLAGFPSVAAYCLVAGGGWAAFRLPQAGLAGGAAARRLALVRAGQLALALALGLLIGSAQLPTTLENLRESGYEAARTADRDYYAAYHLPAPMAISLVLPRYFGDGASSPFWGATNFVESTAYVGLLPLLLAPLALAARARRSGAVYFAALAAAALMLVYGVGPLLELVSRLPVFNSSASTRTLLWFDFALAALAAMGAQTLLAGRAGRRGALAVIGSALAIVVAVVGLDRFWATLPDPLGYLRSSAGLLAAAPTELPHPLGGLRSGDLAQLGVATSGVAALVAGLLAVAVAGRWPARRRVGAAVLVGVAVVDLFTFGGSINTVLAPAELPPEPPTVTRLRAEASGEPFRVLNLRETLLANVPSVWGIGDVGGHATAQTGRYSALLRLIDPNVDNRRQWGTRLTFAETADLRSPLLDLLGVRYVTGPPNTCNAVGAVAARQEQSEDVVGELAGATEAGQTFTAEADGLDEVCVMIATYGGRARGELRFSLRESVDGAEVSHATVAAESVPDNTFYPFRFPPLAASRGRQFYVGISDPSAAVGAAPTLWRTSSDSYAGGEAWLGGAPVGGDLRFRAVGHAGTRWSRVETTDLTLWQNGGALPRAFVAPSVEVTAAGNVLARLGAATFDPGRAALVESPPPCTPGEPGPRDARLAPLARLTAWRPGDAVVATTAPGCSLLVFTESYYPGWRADIDGQPADVVPADGAFIGVWMPEGAHTVRLRFTAPAFERGLLLSAGGTAGLVMLWLLDLGLSRRRPGQR